jgi:hypothetical protein
MDALFNAGTFGLRFEVLTLWPVPSDIEMPLPTSISTVAKCTEEIMNAFARLKPAHGHNAGTLNIEIQW